MRLQAVKMSVLAVAIAFLLCSLLGSSPASAHSVQSHKANTFTLTGVHVATSSNTSSNFTNINDLIGGQSTSAIVFVTPNWNPGGVGGTYDNHPIGVWYNSAVGEWSIFNQDGAAMPIGAAFSVEYTTGASNAFVHTATASNSSSDFTNIDNALSNNHPNAILIVTPNWNPGGVGGTYNNHPIGVWYNNAAGKWSIFNEDLAAVPHGAAFNVQVLSASGTAFVHLATYANSAGDYTNIDNSHTNNNPNNVVLFTPNWNPGGIGSTYNNHNTGVWYNNAAGKASIFNEDLAAIPNGAAFNVLVEP